MTGFRLTPRAVNSLVSIFTWTIERFGLARAEAYRAELIERCRSLAAGETPRGRPCSILLGANDPSELFYARSGGHFIVYRSTADEVVIVDFIHERRDLPTMIRRRETDAE